MAAEEVYCLWGRYEPAEVKAVLQGMYTVTFKSDGATRAATASELVLEDRPLPQRLDDRG